MNIKCYTCGIEWGGGRVSWVDTALIRGKEEFQVIQQSFGFRLGRCTRTTIGLITHSAGGSSSTLIMIESPKLDVSLNAY
jgi:hypothetical protein